MKFVDFGGFSRSGPSDRSVTSSNSQPPRKDRPLGDSAPSAAHVVFDPFVPSRRRGVREGRVYTPYGG